MNMPFTPEQFFAVFAQYNAGVWPMQVVLNALALAVIALLFRRVSWGDRVIAAVLAFLWTWMALAYHFAHFAAINPAAWGFGAVFLLGAAWLAWTGVVQGRLRFVPRRDARGLAGALLILYALVLYPLLGHLLGHRYPAAPSFGLPCPTTIFTLGMLLLAAAPVPRSVFVVPLLWAAVGSVAAFKLGVVQDLGLLAAGLVGLASMVFVPAPARLT